MGEYEISILLAVHNGEKYIQQAIRSVMRQTKKNFELLICANGCTDNTIAVIGDLLCQYSDYDNIKLFTLPRANKCEALNYLLKQSKGNYIAVQDADDIWMPNKLELQSKYLYHYGIIGSQCEYIDHTGNQIMLNNQLPVIDSEIKHWITKIYKNPIINTSVLVQRKLVISFGGYDKNYEGVEDFFLWAQIASTGIAKFINVNEKLVQHRLHADSHFNASSYQTEKIEQIKEYINQINL